YFTKPRITALRPGASPPPVRIPIRRGTITSRAADPRPRVRRQPWSATLAEPPAPSPPRRPPAPHEPPLPRVRRRRAARLRVARELHLRRRREARRPGRLRRLDEADPRAPRVGGARSRPHRRRAGHAR